jgi:hypothetical protein
MAQNTLTETTLAAAVDDSSNIIQVASATGITTSPNTTATMLFVDRELITVLAVNGTEVTVARGANGTPAAGHASGAVVLAGNPKFFIDHDPQGTTSNALVTPLVNTSNGQQWLLSSVTGTWVPGFGNPGSSGTPIRQTAAAADAAGIAASGPLFVYAGTTQLTSIAIPVGFKEGSSVTICFTGSGAGLTWTTGGASGVAFAVAGTSTTAGSCVTFTYLTISGTGAWHPSRLA